MGMARFFMSIAGRNVMKRIGELRYFIVLLFVAYSECMAEAPIYSETTKVLELPTVNIDGTYYFGVRVRLDSIFLVGGPTGSGTCDPGSHMELVSTPDFSCFADQPSYDAALVGTWEGVDKTSNKISLTFPPSAYGSGVFSAYTVAGTAAPYHNCNFVFGPTGSTPEIGFRSYGIETIACDEGAVPVLEGTTPPLADLLLIRAYGGKSRINRLVVSNARAFGFSDVPLTRTAK